MINQYILISSWSVNPMMQHWLFLFKKPSAITSIHIFAMFFFLMSYGTSAEIVSLHFVRMQSSLNPVQIDIIIKFYARCLLQ